MKKNILLLLISVFLSNLFAQSNNKFFSRLSVPRITVGEVYSDIILPSAYNNSELGDLNATKKSYFGSIGTDYSIFPWLKVESNLTYQERKALEFFLFPTGDSSSGFGGIWIIGKVPTSPQSEYWSPGRSKHLPNFKYLDVELIPKIEYGGRLKYNIGFGVFYGLLLNRDEVLVTKEDLPGWEGFFQPPFNLFGEVPYHRYDYGWLSKGGMSFQVTKRINIGLIIKAYRSRTHLSDTFIDRASLDHNMRWKADLVGLTFRYGVVQ